MDDPPKGRRIMQSLDEPSFLDRTRGRPVYAGFEVTEHEYEGFRLGLITEPDEDGIGDAFLIAPDNSRAGIVYDLDITFAMTQISPFESDRWGVWSGYVTRLMTTEEGRQANLVDLVNALRPEWERWQSVRPNK